MKRKGFIICSVVGAIVCSAFCIGYSIKDGGNIETIKSEDYNRVINFNDHDKNDLEINDYWENTSMEEIRSSILGYIDEMMNSTIIKLQDFKKENNESKIKLYESEIKRLNKIFENVKSAETKEDLRNAMQVRHKSNF